MAEREEISLDDIYLIEEVLERGIHIISQIAGNEFVRKPSEVYKNRGWTNVFVYHHRTDPDDVTSECHYKAISKLLAFFKVKAMCEWCFKPKSDPRVECCHPKCKKCLFPACIAMENDNVKYCCVSCHTLFSSSECFKQHQTARGRVAACQLQWTCHLCPKIIKYAKEGYGGTHLRRILLPIV